MPRLRDVVSPQTRLLLVGINPSLRSAAVGHHFASPGNPFWRLLFAAKLVEQPLTFEQDHELARFWDQPHEPVPAPHSRRSRTHRGRDGRRC